MPSCGFHNSPRANVAQLGHWSSEKLTGLRIMICSLQSSGVSSDRPLTSPKVMRPFRTDGRADRCHWRQFYSKSKWVAGAFGAKFNNWNALSASLLFWDVFMQSFYLKKRCGLNYHAEIKLQISSWLCDGISFLTKCPGKEAAWEDCPG